MSEAPLEAFLARIYVDATARARFIANPSQEADLAGLSHDDAAAISKIDPCALEMAARSFAAKRQTKAKQQRSQPAFVFRTFDIARRALRAIF
jgi:hypothetical protein